jgi:hypothetical protein
MGFVSKTRSRNFFSSFSGRRAARRHRRHNSMVAPMLTRTMKVKISKVIAAFGYNRRVANLSQLARLNG